MSTEAVSTKSEETKPQENAVGSKSQWTQSHKETDRFMLSGEGSPDMEVITHGGAKDEAERGEDASPKEVEDFTEAEYQRWLKDGKLPERAAKSDATPKEKTSETRKAQEAEHDLARDTEGWDWTSEEHSKAAAALPSRLTADLKGTPDFEAVRAAAANISIPAAMNSFMSHVLAETANPANAFRTLVLNPAVISDMSRDWAASATDSRQRFMVQAAIRKAIKTFGNQRSAPKTKEVTAAKRPPSEVGGRAASAGSDEDREDRMLKDGDIDGYIAARNAREVRERRERMGSGRRR